jgi:hypothetical protein
MSYDLNQLAPLLCCEPKWGPIYRATTGMNYTQLKTFVDELRMRRPQRFLPLKMEQEFQKQLEILKQKESL